MSHLLDPKHLSDDHDYCAARDELLALALQDPDTPAGWRFDELSALIHDYEAARGAALSPASSQSR